DNVAIRCQVNTSISALVQKGDLSERLVEQLVNIFQWDIDFERDVRAGDQLTIIYDSHQKNRKDGKILAAEFINQGNVYRAIRYTDTAGLVYQSFSGVT
ncbi:M24/M37 family peptidase, partial [Candidatus Thiomargarita nelsonii]